MPGRALTLAVVAMGIAILAGLAAIGATIAGRMSRHPPIAIAAPSHSFTAPSIELPAGAHIEAMSAGSDRLVLDVLSSDGSRQLIVIDLATGRRLGIIPLRTAP